MVILSGYKLSKLTILLLTVIDYFTNLKPFLNLNVFYKVLYIIDIRFDCTRTKLAAVLQFLVAHRKHQKFSPLEE